MRAMASGPVLRVMVVSTVPGAMAFTRTPWGEYSPAIDRVNDRSPALAAEYMAVLPAGM